MYDPDYDMYIKTDFGTHDHDSVEYDQKYTTPKIPTKVPPLKEISSVAVAIALWKHNNMPKCISTINPETTRMAKEWSSFGDQVRQSVNELPVPTSIANYIDTYVGEMEKEILDWLSYHLRTIFFQENSDYLSNWHIYNLVWHPNGAINYKETARSLLSSSSSVRLSDMEKYRFSATYCLKEEMEKMPASLFSDRIVDYVQFDEYPLIFYWNHYLRTRLNSTSAPKTEILPLVSNLDMVLHPRVDKWQSKEYFFHQLSSDEQVECAKKLITEGKFEYQKLLLMKLNRTQRIQVYVDKAADIIINYARADCHNDDVLPTWLEIRHLITEHQFLTIFVNILKLRKGEILKDIWMEAPSDLKRHTMKLNDHELIRRAFHSGRYYNYKYAFKLDVLFAVLSDVDASLKRKLIDEKYFGNLCEEFLCFGKPELFDRLLRLFFKDEEELTKFKLNFAHNSESVRRRCTDDYIAGYLERINSYLDSLMSSKSEAILQYKKNLLMSESGLEVCSFHLFPPERRPNLRGIISDAFPTKVSATEFAKKVIFSKYSILNLQCHLKIVSIDRVQECIDYFLESNEDKRTLKKQIIQDEIFLCELLGRYDKSKWENFIQWALEDDQAIEDFKLALNLDSVFDRVLKSCIFKKFKRDPARCTLNPLIKFNALDLFLKWYFAYSSEVSSYKRRKIDSWMHIDSIETLMKLLETENDRYIELFLLVMKWFFGNDMKQIVNFKNKVFNEGIKY